MTELRDVYCNPCSGYSAAYWVSQSYLGTPPDHGAIPTIATRFGLIALDIALLSQHNPTKTRVGSESHPNFWFPCLIMYKRMEETLRTIYIMMNVVFTTPCSPSSSVELIDKSGTFSPHGSVSLASLARLGRLSSKQLVSLCLCVSLTLCIP